jgi:hypothetical protein
MPGNERELRIVLEGDHGFRIGFDLGDLGGIDARGEIGVRVGTQFGNRHRPRMQFTLRVFGDEHGGSEILYQIVNMLMGIGVGHKGVLRWLEESNGQRPACA